MTFDYVIAWGWAQKDGSEWTRMAPASTLIR